MARQSREKAELAAYLRAKRGYEKKLDDIAWNYEEFFPLMEKYDEGRLQIDITQPAFELTIGDMDNESN